MKKSPALATGQVAKELHDTVSQTLTGAYLHLGVIARRVKKSCPEHGPDLDELHALLARARDELHAIVQKNS